MPRWGDALDRLLVRAVVQGDCLVITTALSRDGYARFRVDGERVQVHRYVYERMTGPIPEGYQIDHLCKTRNCIRVDHLEAVTPRENLLRSPTWAGVNAAKTACPQGHPYDAHDGRGRCCRKCAAEATRRWRASRRSQPAA